MDDTCDMKSFVNPNQVDLKIPTTTTTFVFLIEAPDGLAAVRHVSLKYSPVVRYGYRRPKKIIIKINYPFVYTNIVNFQHLCFTIIYHTTSRAVQSTLGNLSSKSTVSMEALGFGNRPE